MQLSEPYKVNRPVEIPPDPEVGHDTQSRSQHPTLPGSGVPLKVTALLTAINRGSWGMTLTHREIWALSSAAGRWSPSPACLAWKQCLCLPGRFGHQNVQSCDSWWGLWDVPYPIWSLEELGTKGSNPDLPQGLRLKVNHTDSRQLHPFNNFGHQSLQGASLVSNGPYVLWHIYSRKGDSPCG